MRIHGSRGRAAAVLLGLTVPAIAIAVVITAAAGGGIPVNNGPLGPVGEGVCNIVHQPRLQILADGFEALYNTGSAPARIERVTLYKPHGLRLLDAVLLRQYSHDTLAGLSHGWPPSLRGTGLDWSNRVPADGATIAPTKPWKDKSAYQENLVLEIKPVTKVATAAGISIRYTEAGQQYRLIPHSSKLAMFVGSHGTCTP